MILPPKLFWADLVWNFGAIVMIGVGSWFINDYPVRLGAKKMDGPFKWWTLVSIGMVTLNGIPFIPWVFYLVYGEEFMYEVYYRLVALAALGPAFLYWIAIYLVYFGYDSMNFLKENDPNYDFDFPLLISAVGFNLITNLISYYWIVKKYFLIKYISLGYCVFGDLVTFCPDSGKTETTD